MSPPPHLAHPRGLGDSEVKTALSDRAVAVLLLVMLSAWSIHLWPQWFRNPDLSHGLFTPFVFIVLLHEARSRGTHRYLPSSIGIALVIGGLGLAGLTLLAGAGLYAAALEWNHALVEFLLASSLCAFLTAGLLLAALDRVRTVPFNWQAAVAVFVWVLSAPIPPGTYTRLTQNLQAGVTQTVLSVLQLVGIAAFRDGNVIHLAHASVGVEEACSGVRSLLSCVFAAFFLSAVMVRTPAKRVLLVAIAAPLAVAMNFVRSLGLTLLANAGVEIHGPWHDLTGFAVLGVTALLLAGVAKLLDHQKLKNPVEGPGVVGDGLHENGHEAALARGLMLGSISISIALLFVFVAKTHSAPRKGEVPPNLLALLPDQSEGWSVSTREDLYHFSSQLQTDHLAERTYRREDSRGLVQITVYVAYWPAGQASVSLVAAHTPDACWPGSGWVEDRKQHRFATLDAGQNRLPEAQYRSFRLDNYPQHVWYWHLVGGKTFNEDVGSPGKLLSLAWHYGFHDDENQVFVRISSNRSWDEISREPLMTELINHLHTVGL